MTDRRKSQAQEDRRLTGDLINAAANYLNQSTPDETFGRVVLDGCTSARRRDYPPTGHGYPKKG